MSPNEILTIFFIIGTLLSSNVPVKFNLYLKNKGSVNEMVNVTLSGSGFNITNPDGTVDEIFQSNIGAGFNGIVETVKIDSNDNLFLVLIIMCIQ